jgi:hypothetical protein
LYCKQYDIRIKFDERTVVRFANGVPVCNVGDVVTFIVSFCVYHNFYYFLSRLNVSCWHRIVLAACIGMHMNLRL